MITLRRITKAFFYVILLGTLSNFICYRYLRDSEQAQDHIRVRSQLIAKTKRANLSIRAPNEIKAKLTEKQLKKIVWYDFFNEGHGLRNKAKSINFDLCPVKNCVMLTSFIVGSLKSNLNELRQADAVVFQGIHYASMRPADNIPRSPGQIFVFAERESGWLIGCGKTYNDVMYKDVFNWTMTFRRNSDVPMFYGKIISKKNDKTKLLTEAGMQAKRRSFANKHFSKIYADKDLQVVWLVSHCKTYSAREDYVDELRKYIDVDIIGQCGQPTCPKKHSKECLETITKRYKFILSFENTFQTDYVTEKLYDWFSRDIIQVVFGLTDYKRLVPHGTVINAANFVTPKHLANYLKDLGSHPEKYIRYLKRKNNYFTVGHTEMQQQAYCILCDMINNVDSHRKVYPNIAKWWQTKDVSRINSFVSSQVTSMMGNCEEIR